MLNIVEHFRKNKRASRSLAKTCVAADQFAVVKMTAARPLQKELAKKVIASCVERRRAKTGRSVREMALVWRSILLFISLLCLAFRFHLAQVFNGLRLSILRVSSEVCFLVGLGQKMMPGSVVGCAENIVNTVVFIRFHFFTYSVNWMISNRLLDVFLVAFWVPWAHFF